MAGDERLGAARAASLCLLLLLAGPGAYGGGRPLDGGRPLLWLRQHGQTGQDMVGQQPWWQAERGGWHYSSGHGREMLPPEPMQGIWIRSFELSDYRPGATRLPRPQQPSRLDAPADSFELEIDADRVDALARARSGGSALHVFRLSFVGHRSRYPDFDCWGGRRYLVVADSLERADYLGKMAPPPFLLPQRQRWKPFRLSGAGGELGRRERQALAECAAARRSRAEAAPAREGLAAAGRVRSGS